MIKADLTTGHQRGNAGNVACKANAIELKTTHTTQCKTIFTRTVRKSTLVAKGSPTLIFSTRFFRHPLTASNMFSWDRSNYFTTRHILYKSYFRSRFQRKTTCINIFLAEQQVWLGWPSAALTQKSATPSTCFDKFIKCTSKHLKHQSSDKTIFLLNLPPIKFNIGPPFWV